ncbi:hypothetical protein HYN69_01065 [Gemmobacter aquarius]|uniref:DUF2382 domain-containing protein n=1 Tax=Paragemmobacter aquarius TaxID=2169400 RepID=A0A2S0UHK8_9RHOB|nr:DUF2382 domain-containing protein [Gemmobacter aquarius]AWB47281.1 hypothetical protein HYN69_01065 [Gemmobacter aquarius]
MGERDKDDDAVLPLAEERLVVGTRRVVSGRVRLRVTTETLDEPVTADLRGETVEVTRVPVDREVDAMPVTRVEGDVTIVPVVEEVLVVERRLVLREEIHLRRTATVETFATSVPLRQQRVVIERDGEEPFLLPININQEDESDERL